MDYALLSLSQLEHAARTEDNALALELFNRIEDEISEAVPQATTVNDADYSYKVWDAVNAVQNIQNAEWHKVDEKDRITYLIKGLHEDTSPYNNHVIIYKYKGSDVWRIEAKAGQYGEDEKSGKFSAKGFKEAQTQSAGILVDWIKQGFELNF